MSSSEDRAAIVELTHRMALRADQRRWDDVAACFTPIVRVDYSSLDGAAPAEVPVDALVSGWRAALSGLAATQHLVAGHVVELTGETARCEAHVQATHRLASADAGGLWTLGARYDYELVRRGVEWRISALTCTVLWGDGNRDVMRRAVGQPSALGVVERFFTTLEALDVEAFLDVWADDGVQEMPFAPAGFPRRLEGRDALRRQYGGLPDAYTSMRFPRRLRETAEPGVVIAEYRGEIELRAGGRYDNTYIGIFRVDGGRVVHFTEYFDPQVLAAAFGDGELARAFSLADEPVTS